MQKIGMIIAISLFLTACGPGMTAENMGTETGNGFAPPVTQPPVINPSGPPSEGQPAPSGSKSGSDEIISSLCAKISACQTSVNEMTCATEVNGLAGFPILLGAPFVTLAQADYAVTQGTLTESVTALDACVSGLHSLPCSTLEGASALSFLGVATALSGVKECGKVYQP